MFLARFCRVVSSPAVMVVAVTLLAGCSRPEGPPPPPPAPPDKVEQDLVATALHDCLTLDCERAYAHVSTLPPTSPLRTSDAFRAILYHYDADRLLRADVEPDLVKRRVMYQAVVDSPSGDNALSLLATARISRLGQVGGGKEVALNATPNSVAAAEAEAADLLAKSQSKSAEDQRAVRAKLEPRMFSGKATPSDVAMLRSVCKAQKDKNCLNQLDHLILR